MSASDDRNDIRPANKRGSARLAAVQALYQMEIAGAELGDVLAEFMAFRLGKEVDGLVFRDADPQWFQDVVSGVVRDQRKIDPMIDQTLVEGWPLRRIDTTLRAILRAGSWELMHRKDVPGRVIITEYIDVAKAFFSEDEPKIVNGVLDKIGRDLRPADFGR